MEIKGEQITFLLGAGASVDAGIPMSSEMVNDIERLIMGDENWTDYRDLYYYLKSSINYSDGILGKFNEPFNVERLLIVISEIEKRESNIMYPFIGAWNNRLLDLAGNSFSNLKKLHKLIRSQLNEWVGIRNYDRADYYTAFSSFATEIGELMKVFTLNYDLCFETVVGREKSIQLGFTKGTNEWHQSNFQSTGDSYHLYKLHGSINWHSKENKLYISERLEPNPELIFGIQHKLTSLDPYFLYSSILRNACFEEARIILVIGYSFADEYVNLILSQALKSKTELRLIVVTPFYGKDEEEILTKQERTNEFILKTLNIEKKDQLIIINATAKNFLTSSLKKDFFEPHMGEPDGAPFV